MHAIAARFVQRLRRDHMSRDVLHFSARDCTRVSSLILTISVKARSKVCEERRGGNIVHLITKLHSSII